jgi:protoheme IX farnesyltransferase
MGVAAATGGLPQEAWFLFSLVVAWQLPHFLSIAWLHRADYARGGYVMLPGVPGGEASTARQVVIQSLLTLLVSLAAVPAGLAGRAYLFVALAAGALFVLAGVAFAVARTDASARRLLRASLIHLPIVLVAFALDRV